VNERKNRNDDACCDYIYMSDNSERERPHTQRYDERMFMFMSILKVDISSISYSFRRTAISRHTVGRLIDITSRDSCGVSQGAEVSHFLSCLTVSYTIYP
jgi:hypothetical protein